MSQIEITVQGTLNPDGTVQLDEKPNLSPGRVTVVLRQETAEPQAQEGWWPYLQRIRAEREATNYPFMNEAEMQAHLDWLRDDEDRIDRLHREIELEKRKGEQH